MDIDISKRKFQFIRYMFDLQNYLWTIQSIDWLSPWIFIVHNTRDATISIATIDWTLLWNNWMWWWRIIDAMTLTVLTLCWCVIMAWWWWWDKEKKNSFLSPSSFIAACKANKNNNNSDRHNHDWHDLIKLNKMDRFKSRSNHRYIFFLPWHDGLLQRLLRHGL